MGGHAGKVMGPKIPGGCLRETVIQLPCDHYVAFDPASHKCSMMHSQPASPMKSMGKYKTEAEAKTAMASMKECQG